MNKKMKFHFSNLTWLQTRFHEPRWSIDENLVHFFTKYSLYNQILKSAVFLFKFVFE